MTATRPEYPRPHFDRSHAWASLNGVWEFFADPEHAATPAGLDELGDPCQIVVPFAWETVASTVGAQWLQHAWYRRSFTVPPDWAGQRVVLHFGAVHHQAEVWVSGVRVGDHEGGYTSFELDVTDALAGADHAELVVRVEAPLDKREIVHGKQRSIPRDDYDDCAFTPSSGIWQPVWLEARPETFIERLRLTPTAALDGFDLDLGIGGPSATGARLVIAIDDDEVLDTEIAGSEATLELGVADPRLWSPEDPHLYTVQATLETPQGIDRVATLVGLRHVAVDGGGLLLNGERVYVRGVLDQGYWPDTGITAPDDQAFVTDLEIARAAGFNLVRKHLKLEDPRFLHHADRMGMLVWAEPASTGRWSARGIERFESQIEPMFSRDGNHASIVIWGLYNEEWGLDWDVPRDPAKQDAVRRAYRRLSELDRSRPIVDNSGWSHVETDIVDWHLYDETPAGWAAKIRPLLADTSNVMGVELGAAGRTEKLLMATAAAARDGRPNFNSEFGGGKTSVERGWNLRWQTLILRAYAEVSGYVWTELYDIEHESAGIYDIDRRLKDSGGSAAIDVNAETVIIPEITPEAPGRDLRATSMHFEFDVRVSHHGSEPINGELVLAWGPLMSDRVPDEGRFSQPLAQLRAEPFMLSDAVRVKAQLPPGQTGGRLHLALRDTEAVVARIVVDVAA